MRTNIVVDDQLMKQALKLSGLMTKKAVVEEGLRMLVKVGEQTKALASIKGLGWKGSLDKMRRGR